MMRDMMIRELMIRELRIREMRIREMIASSLSLFGIFLNDRYFGHDDAIWLIYGHFQNW